MTGASNVPEWLVFTTEGLEFPKTVHLYDFGKSAICVFFCHKLAGRSTLCRHSVLGLPPHSPPFAAPSGTVYRLVPSRFQPVNNLFHEKDWHEGYQQPGLQDAQCLGREL